MRTSKGKERYSLVYFTKSTCALLPVKRELEPETTGQPFLSAKGACALLSQKYQHKIMCLFHCLTQVKMDKKLVLLFGFFYFRKKTSEISEGERVFAFTESEYI